MEPALGYPPTRTAAAAVFNLTAVLPSAATFLAVTAPNSVTDACPTAGAGSSNLNPNAGETEPNRVISTLGPHQDICVYNSVGSVNFIVDVSGWFGSGGESTLGADFYAVPPTRICDTRADRGHLAVHQDAGACLSEPDCRLRHQGRRRRSAERPRPSPSWRTSPASQGRPTRSSSSTRRTRRAGRVRRTSTRRRMTSSPISTSWPLQHRPRPQHRWQRRPVQQRRQHQRRHRYFGLVPVDDAPRYRVLERARSVVARISSPSVIRGPGRLK